MIKTLFASCLALALVALVAPPATASPLVAAHGNFIENIGKTSLINFGAARDHSATIGQDVSNQSFLASSNVGATSGLMLAGISRFDYSASMAARLSSIAYSNRGVSPPLII